MPDYVETRAIRGAEQLVSEAQDMIAKALASQGPEGRVGFPDTAYYLPIILGITGQPIARLKDLQPILQQARALLDPKRPTHMWSAERNDMLDAGMAALIAAEALEALRFSDLEGQESAMEPASSERDQEGGWIEKDDFPIEDALLRTWGVRILDERLPGFALILGAANSNAAAVEIIGELRRQNILCFLSGAANGQGLAQQLRDEGVGLGCEVRTLSLGKDSISAVHALGFATRLAIGLGDLRPGAAKGILGFSKSRVRGFVLALGELDDAAYAVAAGAMNFGVPMIADTRLTLRDTAGRAAPGHIISLPFGELGHNDRERSQSLVRKCMEARGIQTEKAELDIPVAYGAGFEDEILKDADVGVEFGNRDSQAFELLEIADAREIVDGKIEVRGPDIAEAAGSPMDLGLVVRVAGAKMQPEFEPMLERQMQSFLNSARGIQHVGHRDRIRIRVSKAAVNAGVSLVSFGKILQRRFHEEFGSIADRVQVTIITEPKQHAEWLRKARVAYAVRDQQIAEVTDADVKDFYACTGCQCVKPSHVCIISPERPGPCGAHNWHDCRAMSRIEPKGNSQPVQLGKPINLVKGQWEGINAYVRSSTKGAVREVSLYSLVEQPMTACACLECVVMQIPEANGVMVVSREDSGMTPAGLSFAALAEIAGNGQQTPGIMGVAKSYLISPKFISGDGGFRRVVWMSSALKEAMGHELSAVCAREGDADLLNKIADGRNLTTVGELLPWLRAHHHPAVELEPIF